jgi:hypothetical protein
VSRHWYAQTTSWASISKAKRQKRKARRAAHGPYAPRGKSSQLHNDVRDAVARTQAAETRQLKEMVDTPEIDRRPSCTHRAPDQRGENTEK